MENWAEGNYDAATKAATVYEKEGKLLLAIAFDVGGTEMKTYSVLVQADGTVNTATVGKLKEWSGWDGIDPYWFVDNAPGAIACEVAVVLEPGFKDASKMFPKIKWVNKVGGTGSGMPEMADRRAVLSKYGAKFRAIAGPQPTAVRNQPVTQPQRPVSQAASNPPPRQAVAHATLEECWRLMQQYNQNLKPDEITEKWYAFVDATGMDQADMTPEGWDSVKNSILAAAKPADASTADEENLPF